MNPRWQAALEAAREVPANANSLMRLSKEYGDELARWAVGQWQLRALAKDRFDDAENWFFVREALMQATHPAVATYHASRFPNGELVIDACTGIGVDSVAISRRGPVLGFEIDAERAWCAQQNLAAHELSGEILVSSCLETDWNARYAYADPARRVASERTIQLEKMSPDPFALAARMATLDLGLMKMSPMVQNFELDRLGTGFVAVSYRHQCREVLIELGQCAAQGWSAHHIESGATIRAEGLTAPEADGPLAFVGELDPAALRSGADGDLCNQTGWQKLGRSRGYITTDTAVDTPWARWWEVQTVMKLDASPIKQWLRSSGFALESIKSRSPLATVEAWMPKLKIDAPKRWVGIVIQGERSHDFIVATPVAPPGKQADLTA